VPTELVYSGNYNLKDKISGLDVNAGELVLSPTRTYAPIIKEILNQYRNEVHGMIHCSGGAQTKVLHFVDNLHVVKNNMFDVPPLFSIIQSESQTDWKEMYKVFNMGHRFELYVPKAIAEDIIKISKSFDVDAQIVGYCEANEGKKLTIKSDKGEFVY
jgi:phosphoribosylformylglycinamidine cyclo-ligase